MVTQLKEYFRIPLLGLLLPAWSCGMGLDTQRLGSEDSSLIQLRDKLVIRATPGEGKAPLRVSFDAHAPDADTTILSYKWDFGDGPSTSTNPTPSHEFKRPGRYVVTLNAVLKSNFPVINQRENVEASYSVLVTTTKWPASSLELELGSGWTFGGKNFGIWNGKQGGKTKVTLPGAANGSHELWFKMYRKKLYEKDPVSSFILEGMHYDFVPKGDFADFEWKKIRNIYVKNNRYQFTLEDVPDGGVRISHIEIRSVAGTVNNDVAILPWKLSEQTDDKLLTMRFGYSSIVPLVSFSWDFGDETQPSTSKNPEHSYKQFGRFTVSLSYVDENGASGLASFPITVRPSKTKLPGLKDIKRFAIWSPGTKSGFNNFNERRYEELRRMHVDTILPAISIGGYADSLAGRQGKLAQLDRIHAHGLQVGLEVVPKENWFTNDEKNQPSEDWDFDRGMGSDVLESTDIDGNGVSDLDGHPAIGWVYLGHEMGEYSDHQERVTMNEVTKEFFPNTMTVPYYGSVHLGFERGKPKEEVLGPGEGDVVSVSVSGPFRKDENNILQPDPSATLESILRNKQYADFQTPDALFWVNTNLPGEKERKATPNDMWSAKDILDYARVLMSVRGINLMSFRALGRFKYDLGYGMNTADPTKKETGFVEQRLAVETIGSWISQTKRSRPVLIIQNPEIGDVLSGNKFTVEYAVTGRNTKAVGHAVFETDTGSRRQISKLSGKVALDLPQKPGKYTLTGYLVRKDGNKVPDSETRVIFNVSGNRGAPLHAINCGGSRYEAKDGTIYKGDRLFFGGKTTSAGSSIAGTEDDILYRSQRSGVFSYALPVADGDYDLTLKMSELFKTQANQRTFDIEIEGQKVVRQLDIYARTGRKAHAYDITVPVSIDDGTLNIRFVAKRGSPQVNGIVVQNVQKKTYRINCGGSERAVNGKVFQADSLFVGGGTSSNFQPIANTTQDSVYQSQHTGAFSYHLPIAKGYYNVRLKFAELFKSSAGERVFDVEIENEMIQDIDIFSRVGQRKSMDVVTRVEVVDGVLNINFLRGRSGAPQINAIVVTPLK